MAIGSASHSLIGRTAHQLITPRLRALTSAVAAPIGFVVLYFLSAITLERSVHPLASELAPAAEGALLLVALLLATPQRRWLYLLLALAAHFAAESGTRTQGEVLVRFGANAIAALCGALPIWRLDRSTQPLDNLHSVSLLIVFGALIGPLGATLLEAAMAPVSALAPLLRAFAVLAIAPWVVNGTRQLRGRFDATLIDSRDDRFGVMLASAAALLAGSVTLGTNRDGDPLWLASFNALLACALPLVVVLVKERRYAQRELETADARFQAVFDHHVMPMALWREGSPILKANRAFLRLAGPDAEVHPPTLLVSGSVFAFDEPLPDLYATEGDPLTRFSRSKMTLQLADGRNVPVVPGAYFADATREGVIHALDLAVFRDAESRRQQAENLHAAVLDSLHEQVAIVDAKGEVIETNESWRKAAEAADPAGRGTLLAGSNFIEVCERRAARGNTDARNELHALKAVLEGSEIRCQLECAGGLPGAAAWLEISIEKLRRAEGGAVITCADVTSRKRAEVEARAQRKQLTHLGRVALLGQLSGAFAHELNQPLTSILGNAEAALRLLDSGGPAGELHEILHDIIEEDLRAAQVIQRLRALLDKGEPVREPVNLNTSVHDVLGLCRSELIARNVHVHIDLDSTLPDVMADRVQMQQIILNLLMNACDAMADCPVAERTVALATRVSMEPLSVQLSISDSGPGIPGSDLDHIFQPFVSSKPHGMGLGLAICRAIAESHRGRLWAANVASVGAVFHLVLPAGGALS